MNILTLKYNLDWRGVKPLAEKLVKIPTQDMLEVNASTSYLNPLQKLNKLPELKEYFDFITTKVQDFVGKDKTIMIERAWFSKYDKDGHIVPHTHPSSTAVACLYIEFPSMDLKYNLDQLQNAHNFYFTKNSFLYHLSKLGLDCLEHGVASKIHQYGIFKNEKIKPYNQNIDEYKKIIKMHRNFCYNFYFSYLLNLYLRKFIKKIIGKNLTTFIKSCLKKIRK